MKLAFSSGSTTNTLRCKRTSKTIRVGCAGDHLSRGVLSAGEISDLG